MYVTKYNFKVGDKNQLRNDFYNKIKTKKLKLDSF